MITTARFKKGLLSPATPWAYAPPPMMANSAPTGSPMDEMKLSTKTAPYPADLRKCSTAYLAPAIISAVIFGASAA